MVHCGFKEQKMWCVSHWQRKMVSYTIFSYRSKPLFSLASSPIRLLLNLLPSATLLPPPSLLDSKALKSEDILGGVRGVGVWGVRHALWLRNSSSFKRHLKLRLSPTSCVHLRNLF